MKFEIKSSITINHNQPEELLAVLDPENHTMKHGTVDSSVKDNEVVTIIEGNMSVGTLLNTIDDVLKTAILFDDVSSSTSV